MKELNIGNRYHVSNNGEWYHEIIEIIEKGENKAYVKAVTDYGGIIYTRFVKDGEWIPCNRPIANKKGV